MFNCIKALGVWRRSRNVEFNVMRLSSPSTKNNDSTYNPSASNALADFLFIADWNNGFFATFLPAIMLMKESRAAFAAHLSKSCVKSCHHSEHFLQHIAVYTLMRFNLLRPALKCLFTERLAVEAHIVEVSTSVIDDVKAVRTCLVPCKAHS